VEKPAAVGAETLPDIIIMSFLTEDFRRTTINQPPRILSGWDAQLLALAGIYKRRQELLKKLLLDAEQIDEKSSFWKDISNNNLHNKLKEFKSIFKRRKKGYEEFIFDALAAIREASYRKLGLRPFVVQLAGALALYREKIAEMATGEGKTLTAGLTAVLQGWSGLPCHIITVNDYLAERDALWLAPLYEFCDLSVGYVTGSMSPLERRQGHHHDITYTTSKEIVADFLRDRLWLGELQRNSRRQIRLLLGKRAEVEKGIVMRGIYSAIVDEADNILIDEAVTPLIISTHRANQPFLEACKVANDIAAALRSGSDYHPDFQYKDIELDTKIDQRLVELAKDMPQVFRGAGRHQELIRQALIAREFFHRDKQYVIQEGKVVIVDEFTGRLMPQRTWRAGLHQMVEAKENLEITSPSETLARLSFQRFFRFFHKLSGMTGTAKESAGELWHIYRLPVITIPENKPCQRKIWAQQVFPDLESKNKAVLDEIIAVHNQGRPVLVGTRNIKASEELSIQLKGMGLDHQVLNATRHKEEAHIVYRAGERNTITIATNMAGRGTDIKLGAKIAELGGLHVMATECHESRRIDRQLFGRAARQGDPGSARSFVSMEDELIRRYIPESVRRIIQTSLKKDNRFNYWTAVKTVAWAQAVAQRVAFKNRRSVLSMDTWLDDSLSFAQADIS